MKERKIGGEQDRKRENERERERERERRISTCDAVERMCSGTTRVRAALDCSVAVAMRLTGRVVLRSCMEKSLQHPEGTMTGRSKFTT